MIVHKMVVWKIAGFCLAFFFVGCGEPYYRIEGQVGRDVAQVILLDETATAMLDSVRKSYLAKVDAVEAQRRSALDSLANSTSALNGPIARARTRYNQSRAKYKEVFGRLRRFHSFGGNPIFSDEDAGISTQKLLSEIADRFYKGRAFSLETEGQVRRYIRQNLVPLERDMKQKRGRLVQLQRSQSGKTKGKDKVERDFDQKQVVLRESTNQLILQMLDDRKLAQTTVDSTRKFRFRKLKPDQYHLYVPAPLPQGHLVPVDITRHVYQDLGKENLTELLIVADSG